MIFFFISLSTYFCYLVLKSMDCLELLQKEKFNIAKSFKWVKENPKKVFLNPNLLGIILIILAFNVDAKAMGICMVVFYMFMFLYELRDEKNKLKFNGNVIRTSIIILVIYILVMLGCVWNNNIVSTEFILVDNRWIYYIIMVLMIYFNYFIVLISGLINNGIMWVIKKIYKPKKVSKKNKK